MKIESNAIAQRSFNVGVFYKCETSSKREWENVYGDRHCGYENAVCFHFGSNMQNKIDINQMNMATNCSRISFTYVFNGALNTRGSFCTST